MDENFLQHMLLAEFDHEMKTTRTMLARVPFDTFNWAPHEKSASLGRLAMHVATLPGLGADVITKDALVFDGTYTPPSVKSTEDILAVFDQRSGATRDALAAAADADLMKSWSMAFKSPQGERTIFQGSRAAALQGIMMNHLVHHRAQLGVYLRLNDVEIPGSYGPSADEKM